MATKQDFIQALDKEFKEGPMMAQLDEGEVPSMHCFLSCFVFDFTLYDSSKEVQWSEEMLTVIRAILERTTFGMFREPASEEVYLKMVNMPFLQGRLEWGTSIRGAWFQTDDDWLLPCNITVESGDLQVFMEALIEWSGAIVMRP